MSQATAGHEDKSKENLDVDDEDQKGKLEDLNDHVPDDVDIDHGLAYTQELGDQSPPDIRKVMLLSPSANSTAGTV